jgi:tRNA U55 pseudouridine synthase TruB
VFFATSLKALYSLLIADFYVKIIKINIGLILLNKKPGITSFEALGEIKRSLGTGKVGHSGDS